jgi:hypothetical protein
MIGNRASLEDSVGRPAVGEEITVDSRIRKAAASTLRIGERANAEPAAAVPYRASCIIVWLIRIVGVVDGVALFL